MSTSARVSPQAQTLIDRLTQEGLNKDERIQLLFLIENFYPHNRPAVLQGDVVMYELFGLAEVFKVMTNEDAVAIKEALDKCPLSRGHGIPSNKLFADAYTSPKNAVFVTRPVKALPAPDDSRTVEDFVAIPPEMRKKLIEIVLELGSRMESDPNLSYSVDERESVSGFKAWVLALRDRSEESCPILDPIEEESRTFFNELRGALISAITDVVLAPQKSPAPAH